MSEIVALLTTAEAAKYLRLSSHALNIMRRDQVGPAYIKLGRKVFYQVSDLDVYINANKIKLGE